MPVNELNVEHRTSNLQHRIMNFVYLKKYPAERNNPAPLICHEGFYPAAFRII
jgi:hypothetical protein